MEEEYSFSLRENVKKKFLKMLRDIVEENPEQNISNQQDKEIQIEKNKQNQYKQKKEYVLILDSDSASLISNILTVPDIVSTGINYLQSLEKIRKCFPNYIGLYIINPCKNSIDLLINDFHRGYIKQNIVNVQEDLNDNDDDDENQEILNTDKQELLKKQSQIRQYGKIHIRFITTVSDKIIQKMAKQKQLFKRILSCKEINHNFEVYDKIVFRLNTKSQFANCYGSFGSELYKIDRDNMASQLCTILTSIGEINTVKVISQQNNIYQQDFCNILNKKINNLINLLDLNQHSNSGILNKDANDCYILIMDRSADLVAPLMHDFLYQSFMQDVLDIKNDTIVISINNEDYKKPENEKKKQQQQNPKNQKKGKQKNEENIDKDQENSDEKQKIAINKKKEHLIKFNDMDDDQVFQQYKFQHLDLVAKNIDNDLKNFLKSNEVMSKDKNQLNDEDIQEAIQKMPVFRLLIVNYNIHMQIIGQLIEQIISNDTIALAELEQSLATRVQNNGYQTKTANFLIEIYQFLSKPNISETDKLRLAILVFLSTEFNQKDFAIFQSAIKKTSNQIEKDLNQIITIIKGIIKDQNIFSFKKRSTSRVEARVTEAAKAYQQKATLPVSRYTPEIYYLCNNLIQQIILKKQKIIIPGYEIKQDIINGKKQSPQNNQNLEQEENQQNEIRSRRKSDIQNVQDKDYEPGKEPKLIICMLGGISYLEISHLMRLQEKYKNQIQLIIGSNQIINAKDYITNLLLISDDKDNNKFKNNDIFKQSQQKINQNQEEQEQAEEDNKSNDGDDQDQEYDQQDIYKQQKKFDKNSRNKENQMQDQQQNKQEQNNKPKAQNQTDQKQNKPQLQTNIQDPQSIIQKSQKNIKQSQNNTDQQQNQKIQQQKEPQQLQQQQQQEKKKNPAIDEYNDDDF